MAAQTGWRDLKARVDNRLSRYFCTTPFGLKNRRPIVSFTFDNFPESAASAGVPVLDEYGARATFYVSGGEVGKRSDHWRSACADSIVGLHRRGHEIACHTFSHVRTTELDATRLTVEIEENRRYLLGLDPSMQIENFAIRTASGRCGASCSLPRPSSPPAALFRASTAAPSTCTICAQNR